MDALKTIPEVSKPLLTQKGEARLQKTDIFRQLMWFGYDGDNAWIPINAERVFEIQKMNKEDDLIRIDGTMQEEWQDEFRYTIDFIYTS